MIDDQLQEGKPPPNSPALLRVAHELQKGVDALPTWSERSGEAWADFARRQGKAEQDLADRLRRMPGCTIARSPNGSTTRLTLAGVEAKALGGPAAACRGWIAKVQRQALGAPHHST